MTASLASGGFSITVVVAVGVVGEVITVEVPSAGVGGLVVLSVVVLVVGGLVALSVVVLGVGVDGTPVSKSFNFASKVFIGSMESEGSLQETVFVIPILVAVTSALAPSGFFG